MARNSSSLSRTFVWLLLALLILGLAGFGATNLGGRVNKIGKVGESDILAAQYVRALQNEMRAASVQFGSPITFEQAQLFGIQQQALSRLVSEKTLDNETHRIGISVGDETVRDQVLEIGAFQGIDGLFDRDAYSFSLENAGLNEAEFEAELRNETARSLLQKAIVSGNIMPIIYLTKTLEYLSEKRTIEILKLTENDLKFAISIPTDTDLQTFYDANIEDFSLPESKAITYVILTPDMISGEIQVDINELLLIYEAQIENYMKPERRQVERLSFLDSAAAVEAKKLLTSNATDFETLVDERGLNLDDVDIGYVTQAELEVAGAEVFNLKIGEVSAPIESDLGPALFRVNGILPAEEITFEEASKELKIQLATEKAVRVIESEIVRIEDLLAAGATLEELSEETDMKIENVVYYQGVEIDVSDYSSFHQAANKISKSDFPELINLSDGSILAMRLDEIIPERPKDFETARQDLEQAWKDDTLTKALALNADHKIEAVKAGESLESLGDSFQTYSDVRRDVNLPETPTAVISRAFELKLEDLDKVPGSSEIYVIYVKDIKPGDVETEIAESIKTQISQQLNQSLSNDIFQIYMNQVQKRASVLIDERSLNAVHNNFQ